MSFSYSQKISELFQTVHAVEKKQKKRQYSKEEQDVNRQDVTTQVVIRLRIIYLSRNLLFSIIPLTEDHLLQIKCLHSSGQEIQKTKQEFSPLLQECQKGRASPTEMAAAIEDHSLSWSFQTEKRSWSSFPEQKCKTSGTTPVSHLGGPS